MPSETALALGQWPNAPLVFVLAQVRFHPTSSAAPENLRDAIIKRAGKDLITVTQTNAINIQINLAGEDANVHRSSQAGIGYDLLNEQFNAMVRVVNGALTYATTDYRDSTSFKQSWLSILAALQDVQIPTVTRLGMRYVDFILPKGDKVPEDYVYAPWDTRGMKLLPGADDRPILNVSMMDVPYPHGRMRLQFMRGFGIPNLPADLQGMLPPAKRTTETNPGLCGIIDTDRWIEGTHPSDPETLGALFTTMHRDLSEAFKTMTTPAAQEEWMTTSAQQEAAI